MKKDYKKIEIEWLDSMHDSGWQKFSNFDPSENLLKHKTMGYLIYESKTLVAVCQSFGVEREDPTIDNVMQIPKCAIKKINKL